MVVLDVGCGDFKRGDIGIDKQNHSGVDVVCDLERNAIPFPNDSFDKVVSYHFLEHVNNPEQVLSEMVRVSKGDVFVVVPHRYCLQHGQGHKVFFSKQWFFEFARKYGLRVRQRYTMLPFMFFLSRIHEIHVELKKP